MALALVVIILLSYFLITIPATLDAELRGSTEKLVQKKSKSEQLPIIGDLVRHGDQLVLVGKNKTVHKYTWVDDIYDWRSKVLQTVDDPATKLALADWPEREVAKRQASVFQDNIPMLVKGRDALRTHHAHLEKGVISAVLATSEKPLPSA